VDFFSDIGGDVPAGRGPDRLYARVDETSTDRLDNRTLLDVVDADWLDERGGEPGLLASPDVEEEARARVALLALDCRTTRAEEGRIAEVVLGREDPEGGADLYLSLTGAPRRRRVESVTWKRGPESRALAAAGTIDHLPEATRDEVERALRLEAPPQAVAVYDVGQGACAGVIVNDGVAAFLDVGAGCDANARTFSRAFRSMCLVRDPTVVLSHFHHDHWAGVVHFPDLLERTWLVPRQGATLGFSHAVLAGAIRRCGTLLVWPDDQERLHGGNGVEVLRCRGRHRNDSGLAMVVSDGDGGAAKVLLPGDARYREISCCPRRVHSLVAAHHGGRTNAAAGEIPAPDGSPSGRLVYSYGPGNSYRHALPGPAGRHAALWAEEATRRTEDRHAASGLGHVHVYFSDATPDVGTCCAESRPQAPCQR
jgi:glyoxylase-like metal-dependent hydrolase (beta-lactamase superfamily II)